MDNKEQLCQILLTNCGTVLYPRADGRVNIPRDLMYVVDLDLYDMVYMSSNMDNIIRISHSSKLVKDVVSTSVAVSDGKLQIPSKFLKDVGLYGKSLVAVSDGFTIYIKPNNLCNAERLNEFLSGAKDSSIIKLLNILTGNAVDDIGSEAATEDIAGIIDREEIARISVDICDDIRRPSLFLLEMDESKPCLFRPINDPYRFKCCWVDGEPLLLRRNQDSTHVDILYIIPGINRTEYDSGEYFDDPGFLLIEKNTFKKLCYTIKSKGCNTAIGKDLIFVFDPSDTTCMFSVFENPDRDVNPKIIDNAKLVCSNPEKFLMDNFELYSGQNCDGLGIPCTKTKLSKRVEKSV